MLKAVIKMLNPGGKHVGHVVWLLAVLCILLMPVQVGRAADNPDPDLVRGWNLHQEKKYAEARAALETGLRRWPSNAVAHFYLADVCRHLKDWACAEEHYETSLELDDKSEVADLAKQRTVKVKVWRLLEDARRVTAESTTPETVAKANDTLEVAKKLGFDVEQQAVYEQIHTKFQQFEQRQKELHQQAMQEGDLLKKAGYTNEALAAYDRALRISPALSDRPFRERIAILAEGKSIQALVVELGRWNHAFKITSAQVVNLPALFPYLEEKHSAIRTFLKETFGPGAVIAADEYVHVTLDKRQKQEQLAKERDERIVRLRETLEDLKRTHDRKLAEEKIEEEAFTDLLKGDARLKAPYYSIEYIPPDLGRKNSGSKILHWMYLSFDNPDNTLFHLATVLDTMCRDKKSECMNSAQDDERFCRDKVIQDCSNQFFGCSSDNRSRMIKECESSKALKQTSCQTLFERTQSSDKEFMDKLKQIEGRRNKIRNEMRKVSDEIIQTKRELESLEKKKN